MAATRGVAPGWIGAAPLARRNGVSRAVSFQVLRTSIWTVMAAEIKIFRLAQIPLDSDPDLAEDARKVNK